MADVFDEISEDLQREKLKRFWQENGAWIIGGAVGAVLLTGAMAAWRQWDYTRDAQATAELSRLVVASDLAGLEKFAATGRKEQAMIAGLMAAATHLGRSEKGKAVDLYGRVAGTFGVDGVWRDLARVLSVSQRLDKDPPAALEKELADLSGDDDVWRYTARELTALLAARQGQMQKAVDALTKTISDPGAPADARSRAQTLRELYAADVKAGPKT